MSMCPPTTHFAPAERATPEEVDASYRSIAGSDLLRLILDAMPDSVMVLNRFRQIVFGNRAVVDLARSLGSPGYLGLRPGELLSCRHAVALEAGCGTGIACRTCGAVLAIIEAIEGRRDTRECRISRRSPQGPEALDFRVWTTPFQWQGCDYVLFVAADIADEKRRRVLERIFYHDILNTAGVISTMTGMLADGAIEFEEVKDDLCHASETLVHEIKSQRILLAAENSELAIKWETLRTRAFLEELAHTFRNHEVAHGRRIEIAPGAADREFVSDPALLARVLGNLVKNALEASAEGQVVTLGCRDDGREIAFTCRNEQAIPHDVQLQIFQRSFSTKGSDRGIGTYSVKLLTEKYLRGRVSFASTPEVGTVFIVTLPARPDGWGGGARV